MTIAEPYDPVNSVQTGRYLSLGYSWDAKQAYSLRLGEFEITVRETSSTTCDGTPVTGYTILLRLINESGCGQRAQPSKRLLSVLDGRNFVFDNEALARRCRASARLVSTAP